MNRPRPRWLLPMVLWLLITAFGMLTVLHYRRVEDRIIYVDRDRCEGTAPATEERGVPEIARRQSRPPARKRALPPAFRGNGGEIDCRWPDGTTTPIPAMPLG